MYIGHYRTARPEERPKIVNHQEIFDQFIFYHGIIRYFFNGLCSTVSMVNHV